MQSMSRDGAAIPKTARTALQGAQTSQIGTPEQAGRLRPARPTGRADIACHSAHRKRRSVTGGWRHGASPVGDGPEPDPDYCPPAALAARLAFRTHLTQSQLSRHLVNLPAELTRQAGTRVLVPRWSTSISDRTLSVGSRAGDPDLRAVRITSSRSARRAERRLARGGSTAP
jgi:hypothetical protein